MEEREDLVWKNDKLPRFPIFCASRETLLGSIAVQLYSGA